MKYVISRYNHDLSWLNEYSTDYIIYDRSLEPLNNSIQVPNLGSDISDKFKFIIDNYNNLPEIAVYTKANLFKYISKEEFDKVKDNKTFTPIFSQFHPITFKDLEQSRAFLVNDIEMNITDPEEKEIYYKLNMISKNKIAPVKKFSFYDEKGMYNELNLPAFLGSNRPKNIKIVKELMQLLGIWDKEYVQFAPGSNYILPKENILKHPKEFYEKLRSYIDWGTYPGECMIVERGLYSIWS